MPKNRTGSFMIWVFLGILAFVAIYVPFFGTTLQYQAGTVLYLVFNRLGTILVFLGAVILIFGILRIIMGGRSFKSLFMGSMLVWIGLFLLGSTFGIFGLGGGSTGYH